ncbi:MAG TPA: DUF5335 family protein [Thermoanaerobaculia bacterium]|jgi:hypothetical protein
MHTKQIQTADWQETLDALSRSYDGALVSLEIVGGDVGAAEEFRDQPLRGISSDRSGMTIRFEWPGRRHLDHHVAHPETLRIVETDEGAVMAIEIEDVAGMRSFVRFRSPMRPEIFDPAVE